MSYTTPFRPLGPMRILGKLLWEPTLNKGVKAQFDHYGFNMLRKSLMDPVVIHKILVSLQKLLILQAKYRSLPSCDRNVLLLLI